MKLDLAGAASGVTPSLFSEFAIRVRAVPATKEAPCMIWARDGHYKVQDWRGTHIYPSLAVSTVNYKDF